MSSRRRSPSDRRRDGSGLHSSSSRSAAVSGSSRLRMDRNPQHSRINDPSEPAGRRREIDNVMKKARASPNSNGYWDKKLLEVEEKDPNRWRHTGYKQLYIGGSSSPSPSRRNGASSSAPRPRSRSRSPRRASPRQRSPLAQNVGRAPRLPRSPPAPRSARSISASSLSSCSDDSCSVCSPKHRGNKNVRSRSRSFSVPRSRTHKTNTATSNRAGRSGGQQQSSSGNSRSRPPRGPASPPPQSPLVAPQRSSNRPPKTSGSNDKNAGGSRGNRPLTTSSNHMSRASAASPVRHQMPMPIQETSSSSRLHENKNRRPKETKRPKVLQTRIKTEKKSKKRRSSPAAAESSGSDDSSSSDATTPIVAATRLTLSERFGKMAQWSVDRRDIENMRITKNSSGGDLKVMIEEDDMLYGNPPPRYSHSPAPQGHYPDELLTVGPTGLASWDDVRVRYQYYKERGYLRDLTLDDYIKWEEWWYKYQEWLKAERYYEHWVQQQQRNRQRNRKRLPATQRLN